MRYQTSGVIGSTADGLDSSETDTARCYDLLGKQITSGRVFWLRSFWAYSASEADVLVLSDISAGDGVTASYRRISIPCASGRTTMVEFPPPGLKFTTDCVVSRDGTAGCTGGFMQGDVGGAGYEEA